jgi:flagellar M-ring protein FliF
VGFELFNGNTLGMTEFTQRVNYQQALEGELERTIASLNAVEAVRVHVVTPEKSLLASEQLPATASVTVKEKPGQHLDAAQVQAITHLVASSVEGLSPENVVVVDVNGNLLASGEANGQEATQAQLDSRRAAELMAAREVQAKVQKLLDTALGPNKSVVQASVTLDWTERETTTQSFDPNRAAVRSSQNVMETYTTTNATLAGVPGAVANLPPANAGISPENQSVYYTRTEQTLNYEVTQIQSHEKEAPGKIQRLSLSVLVDGVTDPAQLDTLKTVIAAAAGVDTARGDTLAVESLAFDRTYYETQAADLAKSARTDLYLKIGMAVVGLLILAALLWYVQRLLNHLRLASAEAWTPVLRPLAEVALPSAGAQPQLQALLEKAQQQSRAQAEPVPSRAEAQPEARPLPSALKIEVPAISPEEEQLQRMIQEMAEKDPSSLAGIIQLWLNEGDRGHG